MNRSDPSPRPSAAGEDIIDADAAGTLDGLFRLRVRRTPERPAYRHYDARSGEWLTTSWGEMAQEVARWQAAMALEQFHPGDRVAVLLRNSREWIMFEQAALGLGLVVVPLYTDDRPDNVAFVLEDSATRLLLVGDHKLWRKVGPSLAQLTTLKRVVILEGVHNPTTREDSRVRMAQDWLAKPGTAALRERRGDGEALATIVYTSGTTGRPKGVMLSHRNILSNAHDAVVTFDVYVDDLLLSFLPLSHALERTAGYYVPMMAGATVAFARSIQQLSEDLRTVRPTAMIAVPRIFERVYSRIDEQLQRQPGYRRKLFDTTVNIGWRRFEVQQGWRRADPALLAWPLLDRLVARKVRERLGGRLRLVVSGGAALSPVVAKRFIGLGVPIVQGYGMTESSPVVSANPLDNNDPASVGVPFRNVEVRIGEDDELFVRGPNVMLGYWNNHAATTAVLDDQGWLRTGDQARIERGHIHITGRIKDIMVLSNGEKIPPGDIESALIMDPLFEQAVLVGEGRPFLSALVVLNPDHWIHFAREAQIDPFDQSALTNERVQRRLIQRMRALMHDFPGYAKVRRVHASLEAWSVDNGLLTPTLKVKRAQVLERYSDAVDDLYGAGAPAR